MKINKNLIIDGTLSISGGTSNDVLLGDGSIISLNNIVEPLSGGTFTGEINLTGNSYYDEYNLEVDGQITFSLTPSPSIFSYSYIIVNSDGVTEFATKPNLDAIFNEQYNIPNDRILDEGLHALYFLKTPSGVAISIPVNEYNPDLTPPTVISATVQESAKDELIIVFNEPVNISGTTGLSLDNDFSGLTITSIISGNTTDTITLQLSGEANFGDSGNFIYSASNVIEDLSGNALVSGSTSITNSLVSPVIYTTDVNLVESPANFFTKVTGGSSYSSGFGVSTTTFTGAFIYRLSVENASDIKSMIGISTDGTNRAYNTAPAWGYSALVWSTTELRDFINGVTGAIVTPPVSIGSGAFLEIRRDGSNNVTMWYNNSQIGQTTVISGAVYLHIQSGSDQGTINNPTFIQN